MGIRSAELWNECQKAGKRIMNRIVAVVGLKNSWQTKEIQVGYFDKRTKRLAAELPWRDQSMQRILRTVYVRLYSLDRMAPRPTNLQLRHGMLPDYHAAGILLVHRSVNHYIHEVADETW